MTEEERKKKIKERARKVMTSGGFSKSEEPSMMDKLTDLVGGVSWEERVKKMKQKAKK
jgi:hypothetical protein